jgi:hypothetical protein
MLGLVLCGAMGAQAANRYVAQGGQTPASPYATWATAASNIQDAVNAAGTNDTVWVGAGVYTASPNATDYFGTNVVFINKPLTLRNSAALPGDVVIDGQGAHRGVMVCYQQTTANRFVLDGLVISNGFATNSGGGVYFDCRNNTAVASWTGVVQNCVITRNSAGGVGSGGYGGGIYGAQVGGGGGRFGFIVSNCVIRDNRALYGPTNAMQAYGGGLYLSGAGKIAGCSILNNRATKGGGIFNNQSLDLWNSSVVGNSVTNGRDRAGNASTSEPYGGGIYSSVNGPVLMRSCLLASNVSSLGAGGVYVGGGASALVNCTVADNTTIGVMGNYGGVVYVYGGSLQCVNSIVVSNLPYHARNTVEGSGVYVTNCCLIPANYGSTNPPSGLTTNSPVFLDYAAGNYRLATNSPCIDTGLNQPWMDTAMDLDGVWRISPAQDGIVDRGAYEYLIRTGSVWTGE